MKWKIYWFTLFSSLFGVLYWKNTKLYNEKSFVWKASKSLIEEIFISLSAALMPAILIVYSSIWMSKKVKRPAFQILMGFISSIGLMAMSAYFLEALVFISVFSTEMLSGDMIKHYKERSDLRTLTINPERKAS